MTIKEVEEIETSVRALLSNSEPTGYIIDEYARWSAFVHENVLYYVKLPYGLQILRKKVKDKQWNRALQEKFDKDNDRQYYRDNYRLVNL